ncbi:recombinase family protein [Kitasatospora albolonga]
MRTDLKGQPAGIYLRISDDKEDRELGVARQEEDDRRLADQLGVNIVDVYKDNDISASTKKKRPDYRRLLRDAEAGRIKVIIAYTSARITRRPRENEDLIDLAEHHGTVFQYVASPGSAGSRRRGRRNLGRLDLLAGSLRRDARFHRLPTVQQAADHQEG